MTIQQDHVFIDLETSGLNSATDEILEIGAIRTDARGTILASYTDKIKPERTVSDDTSRVNGYSKERWANATPFVHAYESFRRTILDGMDPKVVVVAHFAEFDRAFLKAACVDANLSPLLDNRAWICTAQLVWPMAFCGILHSRKLEALCDYFKVENSAPHTAAGDVAATVQVYFAILRRMVPALKAESAIHGSQYGGILDSVSRIVSGL